MDFDGHTDIMRCAVPHFTQSTAGSVLNVLALCLLRFMALRNPATGERRGAWPGGLCVTISEWDSDHGLWRQNAKWRS